MKLFNHKEHKVLRKGLKEGMNENVVPFALFLESFAVKIN